MEKLIKTKLSVGAEELRDSIVSALELGPIVCLDVQKFSADEDVHIRTAQRYAKSLKDCPEFQLLKRTGSVRYYGRHDIDWRDLLQNDHEFVTLKSMENDPSVVSVVSVVAISYIYIYKERDLRIGNDTNDTNDKSNDNGIVPGPSLVVMEDTSGGAFQEMVSMVCHVCKRNTFMLLDEEEELLLKMFKSNAGVTGDLVYARYSRATKPNFWYSGHWKGKNNAWPTIKDVFTTWEESGDYSPQPYDSWPALIDIQNSMIEIMTEFGTKRPESAMRKYKELGYDIIMDHIPGGYVHTVRSASETEFRIKIATAVREIKAKARKG